MADRHLEQLLGILRTSGADAWEVADINEWGWEFYFIGHRLDQNRAKDVEHINLKVYKLSEDGGGGSPGGAHAETGHKREIADDVADTGDQDGDERRV